MLYTVADESWAPGSPLPSSPRRAGLYRTRAEALSAAPGGRLLAVSLRYDPHRGVVAAADGKPDAWTAPAIAGTSGGVTALASIPPGLIWAVGEHRLRVDGPHSLRVHAPHRLSRRMAG